MISNWAHQLTSCFLPGNLLIMTTFLGGLWQNKSEQLEIVLTLDFDIARPINRQCKQKQKTEAQAGLAGGAQCHLLNAFDWLQQPLPHHRDKTSTGNYQRSRTVIVPCCLSFSPTLKLFTFLLPFQPSCEVLHVSTSSRQPPKCCLS